MVLIWDRATYEAWVRQEASKIHSDGCTDATQFYHVCCLEHDLGYHYGRDPREAYRGSRMDFHYPWLSAPRIERVEVDRRFRQCMQARSPFGVFSPMSWWRWLAVRTFGQKPWVHDQHPHAH